MQSFLCGCSYDSSFPSESTATNPMVYETFVYKVAYCGWGGHTGDVPNEAAHPVLYLLLFLLPIQTQPSTPNLRQERHFLPQILLAHALADFGAKREPLIVRCPKLCSRWGAPTSSIQYQSPLGCSVENPLLPIATSFLSTLALL